MQAYLQGKYFGGPAVELPAFYALPETTTLNLSGNTAAFDLNGNNQPVASLSGVAGSRIILGGGALTVGSDNTDATFAGDISDSGGDSARTGGTLTKVGSGLLMLTGTSSFSGGVTVKGGVLQINSDANLGAASGTLTMAGGSLRSTGNVGMMRQVNLAANATFELANETYLTVSNTVSGTGGLTKAGTGYLTLVGGQTYTGPTTVQGGFFKLESGSLASSSVNLSSATFYLSNDTGVYAGNITGTGALVRSGTGASILTGTVAPALSIQIDSGTLQIGNGGVTGSITSDVLDNGTLAFNRGDNSTYGGVISGGGSLLKQGSGALTLSGANTYAGGTTILAGRLIAGNATALRSGTTGADYAVEGGALDLNNFALTVSSLSGAAGSISLGTATFTVNQSGTTSFGGAITGTGGFSMLGDGSLTLSGISSFDRRMRAR